ncbi:hypothetical protein KBX31_03510 [Liquorilactobacillus satsumensis]|uniref:hypothetical protein n=1 Tax=Liquorilactobacillus satsumensis TaxID=259059 RepID=UPI0021C454C7|nr:hypothetical protein [Liquorilactobacillus satsumensis]MCP9312367.1 hypothetical protein [Liquorilactobacillus satsumensis]MCP9327658.1 hypothetical protein [Liquorilactobacillus satsumensis]MCP9359629.1 hypothetical protein [Liquorilactobacillus satsumensis]
MKKVFLVIIGFIAIFCGVGFFQEMIWRQYQVPKISGQKATQFDISSATEEIMQRYNKRLTGWRVPYNYRIGRGYTGTISDIGNDTTMVKVKIYPASLNRQALRFFKGTAQHGQAINSTTFWKFSADNKQWHVDSVKGKLTKSVPAARKMFSSKESSNKQQESLPIQTPQKNSNAQYRFLTENKKLYVTYDGGKSKIEVPGGYTNVFRTASEISNEDLNSGSYLISPQFTAFIAYQDKQTGLLFRLRTGSWHFSALPENGYRANAFISQVGGTLYVTYAVNRSLGTDYYETVKTTDLRSWTAVPLKETVLSNLSCVFWENTRECYYASKLHGLQYSSDGGQNFTSVSYDIPNSFKQTTGESPFNSPVNMYYAAGKLYLRVGQGEAGDYAKKGQLQEGLFVRSETATNFKFVKEQPARD